VKIEYGEHTIAWEIGDCRELMSKFDDNHFDLMITDIPYGENIGDMGFIKQGRKLCGGAWSRDYTHLDMRWDKSTPDADTINEMMRISKNQLIFGGNFVADLLPRSRCWVVWDKRVQSKYSNDFADAELIWTSFDRPARIIRYLWSGMLQQNMKNKDKRFHPTQKPIGVLKELIRMFSDSDDVICDPYLGSGSTLVASKAMNRSAWGCEIDEHWEEIIAKRLLVNNTNIEEWF